MDQQFGIKLDYGIKDLTKLLDEIGVTYVLAGSQNNIVVLISTLNDKPFVKACVLISELADRGGVAIEVTLELPYKCKYPQELLQYLNKLHASISMTNKTWYFDEAGNEVIIRKIVSVMYVYNFEKALAAEIQIGVEEMRKHWRKIVRIATGVYL